MEISKYTAYFHDGSILDIQHMEDKIAFTMSSAELSEDNVTDKEIILSKGDRIRGKLWLEGVTDIKINDLSYQGLLSKNYDYGRIFDFEIKKGNIELDIDWINFPPKERINEFSVIKIYADRIYWENLPIP